MRPNKTLGLTAMKSMILAVAIAAVGCSPREEPVQFNESNVGKIAVLQSGSVTFNGQAVNIEQLRVKLTELKQQSGAVWYYREAPEKEPPPISDQVIQAVVDTSLPISLSTEPDFSTVALPDGTIRRRSTK